MAAPLTGLKVLDLSRILSGPYCTMILCDLGADVIKVERPEGGDIARGNGPYVNGVSVYFESINRGKKSVTLNFADPRGRELLLRLVADADVLVENFLPGALKELGVDYDTLKQINPSLIYTSISGFGQTGPYAKLPAFDVIIQGMGGIMSVTGEPGGPPIRPGASFGDIQAGMYGAIAILAALHERQASGKGQMIDLSMLDCQVATQENAFSKYLIAGEVPERLGTRHPISTPFQAFQTKDGYLTIAIMGGVNDKWPMFCSAIERVDLVDDTRYKTSYLRSQHYGELEPIMTSALKTKTTKQWLKEFRALQIPCGPLNSIPDVVKDPQIRQRKMFVPIEHPKLGTIRLPGSPMKLSRTPPVVKKPSPELGENNWEILGERLGVSRREFDKLKKDGVV